MYLAELYYSFKQKGGRITYRRSRIVADARNQDEASEKIVAYFRKNFTTDTRLINVYVYQDFGPVTTVGLSSRTTREEAISREGYSYNIQGEVE